MTSQLTTAHIAAIDPQMARALHLISRMHGRLNALEEAIAAQDARLRLRATLQIAELLEELSSITYRSAA